MSCPSEIPVHLHKGSRPVDPVFSDEELLYRRIRRPLIGLLPDALDFDLTEMSVNRELYSNQPEDVLWNINASSATDHFHDQGIVSFPVREVRAVHLRHPQLDEYCVMRVMHQPEDCMYPHSVVVPEMRPGQGVSKPSKMMRTELRTRFRELSQVIQTEKGA